MEQGAVRCPECGASLDEMFDRVMPAPVARSRSGGSPGARAAHPATGRSTPGPTGTPDAPADASAELSPVTFSEPYRSPVRVGRVTSVGLLVFAAAGLGWVGAAVAHRRTWAESGSGPLRDFGTVSDWFAVAVIVVALSGAVALVSCGVWLSTSNRNLWAISKGGRLDRRDLARRWWPVAILGLLVAAIGLSDFADSGLSIALMIGWAFVSVRALASIVAALNDIWWRTGTDTSWPPPPVLFRVWALLAAGGFTLPVWTLFLRADPSSIASRDLQIVAMVCACCAAVVGVSIVRRLTDRQERAARRTVIQI